MILKPIVSKYKGDYNDVRIINIIVQALLDAHTSNPAVKNCSIIS